MKDSHTMNLFSALPYENMPTTRYQGSKRKLLPQLYEVFSQMNFETCLDAFGGTGSVTHLLRMMGKKVVFNDILPSNAIMAKALFANDPIHLSHDEMVSLLQKKEGNEYKQYFSQFYEGIYFTQHENEELDIICQNIHQIKDPIKASEAFYCLFQSCLSKRPYNLFHRANLHMRLKDVKRSFGNKATWDKPFIEHMNKFYKELGKYRTNNISRYVPVVSNEDLFDIQTDYDLVYIDTPYAKSHTTQESNYFNFYHFLDAMVDYFSIPDRINYEFKHRPIYDPTKIWYPVESIKSAFSLIFQKFQKSQIVVSYRSDGYPSPLFLIDLLQQLGKQPKEVHLSDYKYVLSTRKVDTKEIAIIAE